MKIVLAPDSFKECLSAAAVCAALRQGIASALPSAEIVAAPMADGGEGTIAVLRDALPGNPVTLPVTGPSGQTIEAKYWYSDEAATAVIETAAACGLALIPPAKRNPRLTTTRGAGELIRDALARNAQRLLLTIGGSGTVDGGTGLARALGYEFLDRAGRPLPEGGGSLMDLATIKAPAAQPWRGRRVEVACDVTNPLLGEAGAARVYGPQKGADPQMVIELEDGLARLAAVLERDLGLAVAELPGAGAAGGLGAGLAAFMGAKLLPGVELVLELIKLREKLRDADLVITGEGRTDSQTASGKVCAGVAAVARELGLPCVVLSGSVAGPLDPLYELGVTAAFGINPAGEPLAVSLPRAAERLRQAAARTVLSFTKGELR